MFKLITFFFIPLFKHFKGTEENKHRQQRMTGERCPGLQGAHGCPYSLDPHQLFLFKVGEHREHAGRKSALRKRLWGWRSLRCS